MIPNRQDRGQDASSQILAQNHISARVALSGRDSSHQGGQCGCPSRIASISSRPVLTTIGEKIIRGVQTILYIPQTMMI